MNGRVFVSGNFFSLHAGHFRLLRFASELGSELVVGVSSIRPSESFPSAHDRALMLTELRLCDRAFVMEDGLEAALLREKPQTVVKGKEFEFLSNTEEVIISRWGGKLVFGSGESSYSGRDLLRAEQTIATPINVEQFRSCCKQHGISISELANWLSRLAGLNVVVIGDSIVDEYVTTAPVGLSREDPTIVVRPEREQRYIGGAAIVAAHCQALGANTTLHTLIGQDDAGDYLTAEIKKLGVDFEPLRDPSRPTTTKRRYRCEGKTLLRVNQFRRHHPHTTLQQKLIDKLTSKSTVPDLVIFSDFSYGLLPEPFVQRVIQHYRESKVFVAADSQTSSQLGDLGKFKYADYITPTELEARSCLKDDMNGVATVGQLIRSQLHSRAAAVTLGRDGLILFGSLHKDDICSVVPLPAFNDQAIDPAGAGDSFLVLSAMLLSIGASITVSGLLGSLIAAIQVGRVGNLPISSDAIFDLLHLTNVS